ncbi:hypothetical protein [Vacuolonema iberomarrocanum]|uniref:hypothetical protein n=1 Tax=Vacuolonema iberomarrocanum TaxID=3454632 RepID=UPI0019DE65BF|nr:hypothetical protein [filamentous cyanobacterium LEGE 07170]
MSDRNQKVVCNYTFAKVGEMAKIVGLSRKTLQRMRTSGELQERIHWIKFNKTRILYNVQLVIDKLQNSNAPQLHHRAINNYLMSLPSYQSEKKGRKLRG